MSNETPTCPECGSEIRRDEVDVGVGMRYGPWGCGSCGWSEDPDYDVRDQDPECDEGRLDPWGGLTPNSPQSIAEDG